MNKGIDINREDLLNYLKLSCQLSNVIEGIVTCKIIELTAIELGIQVNQDELQKAADDFRLTQQLHNTEDTWNWLNKNYLSLSDFEALICTNTISGKLVENLFGDRIDSFLNEHQLDYTRVAMYEVVIDDEDLALETFCALQEGEISFQEVAREYINEPSLRLSGGYRGTLSRQDLKPEISAAVFAADPPQFLKPITTSEGVHLILVEDIIQPELDDRLRSQIMGDLFSHWLKQQINETKININLDLKESLNSIDATSN